MEKSRWETPAAGCSLANEQVPWDPCTRLYLIPTRQFAEDREALTISWSLLQHSQVPDGRKSPLDQPAWTGALISLASAFGLRATGIRIPLRDTKPSPWPGPPTRRDGVPATGNAMRHERLADPPSPTPRCARATGVSRLAWPGFPLSGSADSRQRRVHVRSDRATRASFIARASSSAEPPRTGSPSPPIERIRRCPRLITGSRGAVLPYQRVLRASAIDSGFAPERIQVSRAAMEPPSSLSPLGGIASGSPGGSMTR